MCFPPGLTSPSLVGFLLHIPDFLLCFHLIAFSLLKESTHYMSAVEEFKAVSHTGPGGWSRKKLVRASGHVASSDTDDVGYDCTDHGQSMQWHVQGNYSTTRLHNNTEG